jgi:homoserine kinase
LSNFIKIFAPATVANVACGFDVLGFAIEGVGDEILVRKTDDSKGLRITQITGDKGKLPLAVEKNTAGVAAQALLDFVGLSDMGVEMQIRKKLPIGSGLGSSAASAVAGVFAVNALLEHSLPKRDLLPFAAAGEAVASGSIHLDNVAPSLLGGFIFTRDSLTSDVHRIYAPNGLYATVIYPHVQVLTKEARAILKPDVSLKNAITQTANLGGLIIGLFNGDLPLIGRSLQDVLIEPQRAALIPHFYEVQRAAQDCGVLGCTISGAGPSIFALSKNSAIAEEAAAAMQAVFKTNKIKSDVYISKINNEGAIVL